MYKIERKEDFNLIEGLQLLMFTMPTCGPCKLMKPGLNVLENKLPSIRFDEIDAAELPEIAELFGVRSTPTTILLLNGEIQETHIGYEAMPLTEQRLRKYVNSI